MFVHDRDTDADGILDEPGFTATTRVSVSSDGTEGTTDRSTASDTNNASDIFARDCSGAATTCTVTLDQAETVTATVELAGTP